MGAGGGERDGLTQLAGDGLHSRRSDRGTGAMNVLALDEEEPWQT
jgi:hypothetical protein